MSLLYKNLKEIDEYALFADGLIVPATVKKYDSNGYLQGRIEIFKFPFLVFLESNSKDLKSIYDEEYPIIKNINYYMGQSSYNIFLLQSGLEIAGSFAIAHSSIVNVKKYTDNVSELFSKKTEKNFHFVSSCQNSVLAIDESVLFVEKILKGEVASSDVEEIKNFHDLLILYRDKFKIVADANKSNGEIFDRIHQHVALMQRLASAVSEFFSLKKFSAALEALDSFAGQKGDLVLASDDIRPDA